MSDAETLPSTDRLLAIISLQNEIAAARLDFDAIMRVVVRRAGELTGATAAIVELAEGDEMVYHAASGTAVHSIGLRLRKAASLSGRCVELAVPLRCDDVAVDPRVDQEACQRVGVKSMICVPLLHDGVALGVLKVASSSTFAFAPADVATLKLLANIVAVSMHQAAEYAATLHQSLHDALTGLPNRRSFDVELVRAVERHRRHATPLCLALLDLDGFKLVNDQLGHAAGDEVLQQVARELTSHLRFVDTCFRIGGDEFALLLPDTELAGAELAVERCVGAIRAARLGAGRVGVSAGLVESSGESAELLLQRADERMYAMKRGR